MNNAAPNPKTTDPNALKKQLAEPVVRPLPEDGSMFYGTHYLHDDFMSLYSQGLELTRMNESPFRRPRFFHLMQMFRLTAGLTGMTAEAGVFRGLSSWLLCNYAREQRPNFRGAGHFMIDSYEGLSEPTPEDGAFSKKRFDEGAFTSTSLEGVSDLMVEFPEAKLVKGWIPDVFGTLEDGEYRFVHIDVDLYAPTLAALKYFYPRMVPGGIIVVDDYGPWPEGNWPGCRTALIEFTEATGVPHAALDSGNCVVIRR